MRCALTALAFSLILVLASAGPGDAAKRLPVTIDFRIEPSVESIIINSLACPLS